jgi:plasmid stabilization system protein ParE
MLSKNSRQNSCRIEWTVRALLSYHGTLHHIAEQDESTLALFEQRVMRALSLLASQPGIGTPGTRQGIRMFAMPKTGHTVEYRAQDGILLILRWYRQRRKRP